VLPSLLDSRLEALEAPAIDKATMDAALRSLRANGVRKFTIRMMRFFD